MVSEANRKISRSLLPSSVFLSSLSVAVGRAENEVNLQRRMFFREPALASQGREGRGLGAERQELND